MNQYLGALFLGVCLSSTALAGCGDDSAEDDGGTANEAAVNETQAAQAVASSTRAITYLDSGDGFSAATSLYASAAAGLLIIDYSGGSTAQSIPADDIEVAVAASAVCEEACTGEGESGRCDFSGCDASGYFIDGFVEWGAGAFSSDLTFAYETAAQGTNVSFSYHLVSDITYTPTSIDGSVSMDGESTTGTQTANYDIDIDYNAVSFPEGGGCPTSGSVSVSASFDVGGQSYEASGDVTFPVAECAG